MKKDTRSLLLGWVHRCLPGGTPSGASPKQPNPKGHPTETFFEPLEPRVLLSGTPYFLSPIAVNVGTQIQAEHFDRGGEGLGYHDVDAANQGGAFRATEGVDIQTTTDTGGGYNIGWTADGEWLDYSIQAQSGSYDISVRIASDQAVPGDLRLLIGDGVSFTELGTYDVQSTGGWQDWQTLTLNNVSLTTGNQV